MSGTTAGLSEREHRVAIVDDLTDVTDKLEEVLASSDRILRLSSEWSCSMFDTALYDLREIAHDHTKHRDIADLAQILTAAAVGACSEEEQSSLQSHKTALHGHIAEHLKKLYTDGTTSRHTSYTNTGEINTCFKACILQHKVSNIMYMLYSVHFAPRTFHHVQCNMQIAPCT